MEEIKYKGRIVEVVETEKQLPNSKSKKMFEFARRSPGVRAIIINNNKILLSKEYRYELNDYDYRLPGGKVFDRLEDYSECNKQDILKYATNAVKKECFEEVGLKVKSPKLLHISKAGATIVWDLYYFLITDFKQEEQHLEDGEIIDFNFYTFEEIKNLILNNKMSEDRSVGVLLKYILGCEKTAN